MTTLLLTGAGLGRPEEPAAGPEFLGELGQASQNATATELVFVVPAGGVAQGDSVILCFAMNSAVGDIDVADSRGNTYLVAEDFAGVALRAAIIHSHGGLATALQEGDLITITHPEVETSVVTAVAAAGPVNEDRSASAGGIGTTPSSGDTSETRAAGELLIGAIGYVGSPGETFTPGAGFTEITGVTAGSVTLWAEYREVLAIGEYAADGSLGNSQTWAALVTAYAAELPPP